MADRHILLIGFSGSGKSTVGPLLAAKLKRKFVDVDQRIEDESGKSIAAIFKRRGEKAFRRLEEQTIAQAMENRRASVISLGGGAFENRAIRTITRERGLVVFLSCSRREIYRRLKDKEDRPLLDVTPSRGETVREARLAIIGRLLKKRLANYRAADLVISTTGKSPALVARQLLKLISRR